MIKDWFIIANVHRYENLGQLDIEPTEKIEIETGISHSFAHVHSTTISFFRHEQYGAPNDQFSFAKLKYAFTF